MTPHSVEMDAFMARIGGRNDDALRLLVDFFGAADRGDSGTILFEWEQLAKAYTPARAALARARDEQVRRLLGGDNSFSTAGPGWLRSRFQLIARMNQALEEDRATYQLFVEIESSQPAVARLEAHLTLSLMVEVGDFALAARYIPPDPLVHLEYLNALASYLPLYPRGRASSPRLVGELLGFMTDVRLRAAILQGIGRGAEAEALRNAALAGIESDEMRALAGRELVRPGTISHKEVAYRIAQSRPTPGIVQGAAGRRS